MYRRSSCSIHRVNVLLSFNFVYPKLVILGLKKHYLLSMLNFRYSVDLFLPDLGVLVEVDGPSHFITHIQVNRE